jgi:hypothetical protein
VLFLKVCKVPSLHLFRCSQQIHSYFITGAAGNLKHEFGDSGKKSNDSDKWGFRRINGGPVMPYIVRNNSTLRARRITSC